MLLRGFVCVVIVFLTLFGPGKAGFCSEAYTCNRACSKSERYTTKCGAFDWQRCNRYRTVYYTCPSTCYRQVCCEGYEGTECSTPLCFGSTSCLNNNQCTGPDRCSCESGYHLPKCEDTNECSSNNGGCQQVCRNNVGSFVCSCNSGYTLKDDLKTCEDTNECFLSNGGCAHTCTNKPGKFQCSCRDGYTLASNGHGCNDINECSVGTSQCGHSCTNTDGSYTCSCRAGYQLADDGKACVDIDECTLTPFPCDQQCHNSPGSYTCGCETGYYLETGTQSCKDIDECQGIICENGGFCNDNIGGYTCSCAKGYTGMHCELDINECSGFVNGGCEDRCINTVGSFACKCSGNNTLNDDGVTCSGSTGQSVFSKYGLVRQFLPQGCSTILLPTNGEGADGYILLSSTSQWFRLKTDQKIIYTYGIVFVEANAVALPLSLSGMEVVIRNKDFQIITGFLERDVNEGVPYGEERPRNCWTFDVTPRDLRDFLVSNSFLLSYFQSIGISFPDWLNFLPNENETLSVNDLQTSLSTGEDIQKTECKGAPLYSERIYTTLKFGNSFAMSIYGQLITLPKAVSNKKFCIIVDIFNDNGGSVFLILPEESRDILDKFDMFKKLLNNAGVYIRPIGVGVSLQKHISVHAKTTHLQQWNGDELIQYPVFQEANIWIGGDARMETDLLRLSGTANAFISIPSPINMLESVFLEEWNFVVKLQALGDLEFTFKTPFGNQIIRGSSSGGLNALASLGGSYQRSLCDRDATPAGVFLSALFSAEAFLDAPVLRIIKPGVNVKAYVFLASDQKAPAFNQTRIYVANELLDLKHISVRFVNLTRDILTRYQTLLTNHSKILLKTVIETSQNLLAIVGNVSQGISYSNIHDLHQIIQRITWVWQVGWTQLQNDTDVFLDSIIENRLFAKHNVTQNIRKETNTIRNRVNTLINHVTAQASVVLRDMNGAGFRFTGDLNIFGLKIIGLEIELVFSIDGLGACSRFERAYNVLKGERAIRALAVVSSGLVKIAPFLRIDAGVGIGLAMSLDVNGKFAVSVRVEAKFLDIRAQTDMFITNKGLYLYFEGNVWNTFKAKLQISAELGSEWYLLSYDVKGSFVADADGDGSFDDGYLAALRTFTKTIGDEANKRISKLQDGVTKAQTGLTSAQDWLEDKKVIFRSENSKFDDAVRAFDRANDKLEEAKKPFEYAMSQLNEAQQIVDNLCRIKDCKKICIPGTKCTICRKRVWGRTISYPCCKFTSCMISFRDPVCTGLNVLCRAVRGIAYLALEAAMVFVRIPMLALDAAKVAVSAAQFIVDQSRVVLDIAEAALNFAKLGLEAAKGILETAKIALESVKQVVKLGVTALNFVIQYGLENIIDVRNCGFEVKLSTHDKAVFDVNCEVNAFKTGFKTIKLRINFKDSYQSLWYAAKETITSILNGIGNFGRKRRDIEYDSLNLLYKHYRKTRDNHINSTFNDETIDIIADTYGFKNNQTDTEYGIRTVIFLHNCIKFKNIHSFLLDTTQALHDMADETARTVMNSTFVQDELLDLKENNFIANASLTDLGIDLKVAETEFNITFTELTETIDIAKENFYADSYISDADAVSGAAASMFQNQTDDANNIEIINYWIVAMENVTSEYFSADTCVSFLDCAHYAVASLYEMVLPSTDLPNKDNYLQSISALEDIFLKLTSSHSLKILEVYNMSISLLDHIDAINDSNVFCSTSPTQVFPVENQTAREGQTVYLACNATGNPFPTFMWFKDDEQITNSSTSMMMTIHNVTHSDEGNYHCEASNLVTSLIMPEMFIRVTGIEEIPEASTSTPNTEEIDETFDIASSTRNPKDAFPITLVVKLTTAVLVLAVIAVLCGVLCYKHSLNKKFRAVGTNDKDLANPVLFLRN